MQVYRVEYVVPFVLNAAYNDVYWIKNCAVSSGGEGVCYLGLKILKRDMKRRSADLDLTNQRSAQLRSISVPYIRAFWRGKQ